MKHKEAQLILRAHRADGRYRRDDPLFAQALEETDRDPALAAWLAREHAVDTVIAHKIDGIQPPPGLRDAILVGARASRLTRTGWRRPAWLAAAAAVILAAGLPTVFWFNRPASVTLASFGEFSLGELVGSGHQHGTSPAYTALAKAVSTVPLPFHTGLSVDLDQLRATGCQSFTVAGREVFELCFERNGVWYHLYVMRRTSRRDGIPGDEPVLLQHGSQAAAVWATSSHLYSLVTDNPESLRPLFF